MQKGNTGFKKKISLTIIALMAIWFALFCIILRLVLTLDTGPGDSPADCVLLRAEELGPAEQAEQAEHRCRGDLSQGFLERGADSGPEQAEVQPVQSYHGINITGASLLYRNCDPRPITTRRFLQLNQSQRDGWLLLSTGLWPRNGCWHDPSLAKVGTHSDVRIWQLQVLTNLSPPVDQAHKGIILDIR